jgi:hypothetical protein
MVFSGGSGSIVKGSLQGFAKNATKKVIANTVKKSIGRKLGLFAANKLVPGAAELTAASIMAPSTYSSAASKYIGSTEMVVDKDGKQRVLVREGLYNKFMKEYESNKRELTNQYNILDKKLNKSPEEITLLQQIENDLDSLEIEKSTLTTGKDLGLGTAFSSISCSTLLF